MELFQLISNWFSLGPFFCVHFPEVWWYGRKEDWTVRLLVVDGEMVILWGMANGLLPKLLVNFHVGSPEYNSFNKTFKLSHHTIALHANMDRIRCRVNICYGCFGIRNPIVTVLHVLFMWRRQSSEAFFNPFEIRVFGPKKSRRGKPVTPIVRIEHANGPLCAFER